MYIQHTHTHKHIQHIHAHSTHYAHAHRTCVHSTHMHTNINTYIQHTRTHSTHMYTCIQYTPHTRTSARTYIRYTHALTAHTCPHRTHTRTDISAHTHTQHGDASQGRGDRKRWTAQKRSRAVDTFGPRHAGLRGAELCAQQDALLRPRLPVSARQDAEDGPARRCQL